MTEKRDEALVHALHEGSELEKVVGGDRNQTPFCIDIPNYVGNLAPGSGARATLVIIGTNATFLRRVSTHVGAVMIAVIDGHGVKEDDFLQESFIAPSPERESGNNDY